MLLNLLERRYAGEVGFTMFDQNTFSVRDMKPVGSRKTYRERYYKRLFEEQGAMDQTQSAKSNPALRMPLIYRLQFPKQWFHYLTQPLARKNAMDLVIFDAAGEDMDDTAMLDQFYRFLVRATGIIFIADPPRPRSSGRV